MPYLYQIRIERIKTLEAIFKDKKVNTIDPIYNKALELFPMVTEKTCKSYSKAVFRLLKKG